MQIVYFRHQKFNSAIREPKNLDGVPLPLHPLATLRKEKDFLKDASNQKNVQRIQKIGKQEFIILSSWQ
ncbi:hypothetical protein [Desulfogranum marinum]|uniref:hypothetical protein n=1 Tax=Desulfogranum marinum TaxID=453220 RepID=UPI0029C95621|nr:hypothetical protein [Desulfogranum marinum]